MPLEGGAMRAFGERRILFIVRWSEKGYISLKLLIKDKVMFIYKEMK